MDQKPLLLEYDQGIAKITLNLPEVRNALSLEIRLGLREMFNNLAEEDVEVIWEVDRDLEDEVADHPLQMLAKKVSDPMCFFFVNTLITLIFNRFTFYMPRFSPPPSISRSSRPCAQPSTRALVYHPLT